MASQIEVQAVCDPDLYLEASGVIGKVGMHASLAPDRTTC